MSNPTVYSIATSTEPPDGLEDYHVMLARGVIAEALKIAKKLPGDFVAVLLEEECLWDAWTTAIGQFDSHYDSDKGRPGTYGHYAIRKGITTALRERIYAMKGRGQFATPRMMNCPRCWAVRPYSDEVDKHRVEALSKVRVTCDDCGMVYTPLWHRGNGVQYLEEIGIRIEAGGSDNHRAYGPRIERDRDTGTTVEGHGNYQAPLEAAMLKDRNEFIAKTIADLPARTQRIIKARFFEGAKYAAIGKREGVSTQRIQQIVAETLENLAAPLANLDPVR